MNNKRTPADLFLARAREPFRFMDYEGLVMPTGLKAGNLREFIDILRQGPAEMLTHHVHRAFIRHSFGVWDYPNDFSTWCAEALEDRALAEKIAAVDFYAYTDLEQARARLVSLLEEHLESLLVVPVVSTGLEFHFCTSRYHCLPGERDAWSISELREALTEVPLGSIYAHFHEAKQRPGSEGRDDFSTWIIREFGPQPLSEQLSRVDFYFYSLEELRKKIVSIFDSAAEGTAT